MSIAQSRRLERAMWHDQSGVLPSMALPADNRYNVHPNAHSLAQNNRCRVCKTQEKLTVCSGCRVTHYCGPAHQKLDWAKHKWPCKAVRVSVGHVSERMASVKRDIEAAGGGYEAYFRSCPDNAEGFLEFKHILAQNSVKVGTLAGVLEGLRHCLEIEKLCVSANAKVVQQMNSDFTPGLLLRLGWDQECYAFLKEKCNGILEAIYRCDDQSGIPLRPANPEDFSLAHASMLCVLKLRILQDLRNLHQADLALGNKLPAELFNECRSYFIGEATRTQPSFMEAINKRLPLPPFIDLIGWDIVNLCDYVDALDVDYWDALQYPDEYMKLQPMHDTELPIARALGQTFDAWAETPGSFALFDEVCAAWGRDIGLRPCLAV